MEKSEQVVPPASLDSCRDQVEALRLTVAQLQSTNTQYLNDLSAAHIKHHKEMSGLRKEVAQLFGELSKEQETNQELLNKVGYLERQLQEATNLIGTLDAENDRLQGRVSSLNEQIGELQNQSNNDTNTSLQINLLLPFKRMNVSNPKLMH